MSAVGRRRVARSCDGWQPFGLEPDDAITALKQINQLPFDQYHRPPLTMTLRLLISPGDENDVVGPMIRSTVSWAGSFDANFAAGSDGSAFWDDFADQLGLLAESAKD